MDSLQQRIAAYMQDGRTVERDNSKPVHVPSCLRCMDVGMFRRNVSVGHPDFGRAFPCPSCRPPKPSPYTLEKFIPRCRVHWKRPQRDCLACFELSQALDTATAFVEEDWPLWVILLGDYGTGKTHLAYGMRAARRDREGLDARRAEVVQTQDFLSQLYSAMSGPSVGEDGIRNMGEHDVMTYYQNMPILVLDEMGRESQTEASRNRISALLNHRYANRMRTVITSNLSLDDIQATWPNIASRLRDGSLGVIVSLWNVPDARPGLAGRS